MENFLRLREIGGTYEDLHIAQTTRSYQSLAKSERIRIKKTHENAINALDMDKNGGRYLLSGGADSGVHLYDLDTNSSIVKSLQSIPPRTAHKYGISAISWFSFDNGLFTTSSYDNHIKVWDTESLQAACSFDLESKVYSHSMSLVATHSLIASACDNPAIRLCDLKSGSYSHILRGHAGKVIAVKWSPTAEHVLASGGSDGTVRLWDVRKASACIAMLDQYNARPDLRMTMPRAHTDTVNGLSWSSDGLTLVTTGHDNKLRGWDMRTGENLLVNFGTAINNSHWQTVTPLIVDRDVTDAMVFYPSDEGQILSYSLFSGYLWKRAFVLNGRVTCVVDRPNHAQIYSGDSAGQVIRWDAEGPAEEPSRAVPGTMSISPGGGGGDILNEIKGEMTSRPVTFN